MNTTYINFYPQTTRDAREISVSDDAAYGMTDIIDFVDSMLCGRAASAPVEGALDALRDGSIWGDLVAEYGDGAVQDALEELDALLKKQ